jgi:hypothetical protein
LSEPKKPPDVMLFSSLYGIDDESITLGIGEMEKSFGRLEFLSGLMKFDQTDYYEAEMGKDLIRRFAAFSDLVSPDRLSEIKLATNMIEKKLSKNNKRTVNIDPGLLSAERVVLATGKNYSHRIYLGSGIYADLTLVYKGGEFLPLEWTYPDYVSGEVREMFTILRKRYMDKVKS